jgi:hypothetical protein
VEPGLSGGTVVRASLPIGPGVGTVAGPGAARTGVSETPGPATES